MSFILPAVSVYLYSGVSRTTFEPLQWEYDKYCGLVDHREEAEVPEAADGVDSDASLEEDLLWVRQEMLRI